MTKPPSSNLKSFATAALVISLWYISVPVSNISLINLDNSTSLVGLFTSSNTLGSIGRPNFFSKLAMNLLILAKLDGLTRMSPLATPATKFVIASFF